MSQHFCSKYLRACSEQCIDYSQDCKFRLSLDKFIEYCIEKGINYENMVNTEEAPQDEPEKDPFSIFDHIVSQQAKIANAKSKLYNTLTTIATEKVFGESGFIAGTDENQHIVAVKLSDVEHFVAKPIEGKPGFCTVEFTLKNGNKYSMELDILDVLFSIPTRGDIVESLRKEVRKQLEEENSCNSEDT